jgi:hypothetical protein
MAHFAPGQDIGHGPVSIDAGEDEQFPFRSVSILRGLLIALLDAGTGRRNGA